MRNTSEIALGTSIGFVTNGLRAKYYRTRIGNEHKFDRKTHGGGVARGGITFDKECKSGATDL